MGAPANAPRSLRSFLVAVVVLSILPIYLHGWITSRPVLSSILPVPSKTYVISLPRRTDRRETMEHLRERLGVEWSYFDAGEADTPLVGKILDQNGSERIVMPFEWPDADTPISATPFEDLEFPAPSSWVGDEYEDKVDLMVSRDDFTLTRYKAGLHPFEYMSRGPIACYHSHITLISETAKREFTGEPSLILEDDVDVDRDIKEQLSAVWHLLPTDWDMIFLGFCWAHETKYTGMDAGMPLDGSEPPRIRLFPSNEPLCTHAYAVSPIGARRLLRFLDHPPFAYSRSIDQAFKYLISHGQIHKAFTVIPSIVAQYRGENYESDVMKNLPDVWDWSLKYGILASEARDRE
ncbi:hypothetical protein FB45DRAFT_836057 [Roridomyces roridus]|uniref:Glycosyl transferase family 25 domain-containing protein n=1 Tax=Roridomyces roridus TaxID=1738132 RepID=A0AAD7FKV0_9AGAR|nr:hypothetical protein FB45DRAFT_836057 [Roridomyces roridus]